MSIPIQSSGLPSWALTDEDLDKPKGIVKDIESLGMTTQTGIEPTQPTEFIFRDPSATTTLGPRLSAPFSPENPGRSSRPTLASMSRQKELKAEIARTNRLKRLREAEQRLIDESTSMGSDIHDPNLNRGWNVPDLPISASVLGASSLWESASTQKKKFQNLLKW